MIKLRPISLTNHLAKVIEGFMAKWILKNIGQETDHIQEIENGYQHLIV